mmetsp:Transcript_28967/g.43722  ORF Transcript_28967/g.43722 Transcript_28967/m.43722 type:complete len:95 (-) Transcript_28967:320-604(-)
MDWLERRVCKDMLYRVSLKNDSATGIKFKLTLEAIEPENTINLVWPRSGIKDYMKQGYSSHLLTLRKRDPTLEGDEQSKLSMKVQWKSYTSSDF